MSTANEDVNALADRARELGLARKAPDATANPATAANPFGRAMPAPATGPTASPLGTMVEIPPPIARTRASGPIVRHFRVLEPKIQHRADGRVTRRPAPVA